jgi:hypothetical protein
MYVLRITFQVDIWYGMPDIQVGQFIITNRQNDILSLMMNN